MLGWSREKKSGADGVGEGRAGLCKDANEEAFCGLKPDSSALTLFASVAFDISWWMERRICRGSWKLPSSQEQLR